MISIDIFRHAESYANLGIIEIDSSITPNGKKMCKNMVGDYDLVICSVLKRTQQTLKESNIKYKTYLITPLCREFVEDDENGNIHISNLLENEKDIVSRETHAELIERIDKFLKLIKVLIKIYPKIAVISHLGFINWMTRDINYLDNCSKKTFIIS
jgi:broad specificity phosphatase PhoE